MMFKNKTSFTLGSSFATIGNSFHLLVTFLHILIRSTMELMEQTITTTVSNLRLCNLGIVHMSFPEKNIVIDLDDSIKIYEGRIQLNTPSPKQLLSVDLRTDPKPNREARNYAKSKNVIDTTKAMAILVKSPLSKMLGNFFIGFNKGDFPVKIFIEENSATKWLTKQ